MSGAHNQQKEFVFPPARVQNLGIGQSTQEGALNNGEKLTLNKKLLWYHLMVLQTRYEWIKLFPSNLTVTQNTAQEYIFNRVQKYTVFNKVKFTMSED